MGGIWTSLLFFSFPSSLPGGSFFFSFFGAHSGGVDIGVLLEPCDSSDGDDTASGVSDFL